MLLFLTTSVLETQERTAGAADAVIWPPPYWGCQFQLRLSLSGDKPPHLLPNPFIFILPQPYLPIIHLTCPFSPLHLPSTRLLPSSRLPGLHTALLNLSPPPHTTLAYPLLDMQQLVNSSISMIINRCMLINMKLSLHFIWYRQRSSQLMRRRKMGMSTTQKTFLKSRIDEKSDAKWLWHEMSPKWC